MIGPYSYWQAALILHSADLDDMQAALSDSGPDDVLGHMAQRRRAARLCREPRGPVTAPGAAA